MDNNNDNLSSLNNTKSFKEDLSEETDKINHELSFYDEDDFFDVDDWLYDDGEDFLEGF